MVDLEELVSILDLQQQGLSVSAISRRTGFDRKTVRKYIKQGLTAPTYSARPPRPTVIDPFAHYLSERVATFPEMTGRRLLREIQEMGFTGGYTSVKSYLRDVRPMVERGYERRFETPPGRQGQVDFAQFRTVFTDEPTETRIVWLFSMVLGCSRWIFARFVAHQDLQTVLRMHIAAFEAMGGAPAEILYDRMKTAVTDEKEAGIAYNRALLSMADHYGFLPKACAPYRAKTKGKVERPYRYIRADFFLGRTFRNLDDLNDQLGDWLENVANARRHATTNEIVAEAFAMERPQLKPLPAGPYKAVLQLERRITRDGMVSVGGNLYSVPDSTRRRPVEVHQLADEIQIFEEGRLIAAHAILEGSNLRVVAAGHRFLSTAGNDARKLISGARVRPPLLRAGENVQRRPLEIYAAVADRLAKVQP